MNNNIVAVIVTYNRKKLLLECINSLLKQENISCDILVVDNKSTDGTETAIKSLDTGKIKYINTGTNLGGAGGFNFGIKKAVEFGYEYIWLMDDDCIPKSTALYKLNEAGKKYKNFGFLSSKVLWADGNICVMNVQRQTMYKNIDYQNNVDTKITMASFVSCFISVKVIKNVGLPIKEFFIWTDDWEYTRRITKQYESFYIPESIVVHKTQKNIGANIATETKERINRFFYLYRNDIYLYKREGLSGYMYILVRLIYHSVRILFIS
ncbi:MAG: glycosyltransferase family 2 protein, partial [Elusimicrobia bacterium]|nr:glycosyltransferase family 2 protein [Elusimicrobiota bacterium]